MSPPDDDRDTPRSGDTNDSPWVGQYSTDELPAVDEDAAATDATHRPGLGPATFGGGAGASPSSGSDAESGTTWSFGEPGSADEDRHARARQPLASGDIGGDTSRPSPTRPPSEIAIASARVAAIVEAAERAADRLRVSTEQRAAERIAEAERAGELRVQAAEAEAGEIVEASRQQAAAIEQEGHDAVRDIHAEAERVRAAAEGEAEQIRADAATKANETHGAAQQEAHRIRAEARTAATESVRDAHRTADEVLAEGTELSSNLHALSDSLRRNAERLLEDVRLAHTRLTQTLETVVPPEPPIPLSGRTPRRAADHADAAGSAVPADDDAAAVLIRAAQAAEAGQPLESARGRRRAEAGRGPASGPRRRAAGGDFDIPEFIPGQR